jgi:hypothetical protein
MKSFMLGILVGSSLMGAVAIAQNEDFYGRPQWGQKIYPKHDAYGRPNPPPIENGLDYTLPKRNPC